MKKYILFANNNKLLNFKYSNLLSLLLNPQDIIITFNHCLPKNIIFPHLPKYQKIYHFSRQSFNREVPYSGLHIIDEIQDRFDKLFLWPHPTTITEKEEKKEKINNYLKEKTTLDLNKIQHMNGNHSHTLTQQGRQFLRERYNNKTNMSTGMMGYIYIRQIKSPEDKIILIGYEHTMNKEKHNFLGEAEYFLKEKEQGNCHMIELT